MMMNVEQLVGSLTGETEIFGKRPVQAQMPLSILRFLVISFVPQLFRFIVVKTLLSDTTQKLTSAVAYTQKEILSVVSATDETSDSHGSALSNIITVP
jgi:hypothetical protein